MGVFNPMLQHDDKEWSGQPESYEYHSKRTSVALWVAVVVMAGVLGALIYYSYRTVRIEDLRITQMFQRPAALNTLSQRADAADSKLHDLSGNWQIIGERVTKLETAVAANVKEVSRHAETLTQQLHQQMTAELNARTSSLDARLSQLESEQADQRAQVAQLESNLKQDIAAVRDEDSSNLSGIRQQEEANKNDVHALSQKLARERIDFELPKGQTKQLTPEISLQLSGVNQSHQRYRGSLEMLQDRRTVWLRDRSTHEPVRFFPDNAGEPYELVVTSVTKQSVIGYLLVPSKSGTASPSGPLDAQHSDDGAPTQE